MQVRIDPQKELLIWGPIEGAWHYPSYWELCFVKQFPETYGIQWPEAIFSFIHNRMTYICEYEALRTVGWAVMKKWIIPDTKYAIVRRRFDRVVQNLLELNKEVVHQNAQGILRNDAVNLYRRWKETYIEFWSHGAVPELANWGGEKFLMDALVARGIVGPKYLAALEVLSSPSALGFFQEEEGDLLKIALRIKDKMYVQRALHDHVKKYFWLHNNYYGSRVLTEDDFAKRLKEEIAKGNIKKRLHAINQTPKQRAQTKKVMIQKLGLTHREATVARKLGQTISWQDERKKYVWQTNHVIDLWLRLAARIAKASFSQCKDLLPDEVERIFAGEKIAVKKIARERLVSAIHFNKQWKWTVYTGKHARQLMAPFAKQKHKDVQEVHGLVVSKGRTVRSHVRIIFSPMQEQNQMQQGDILVTGMTSPDYIVVMKRAAAIVTDTGGMTSHAAVISRELGIPCIVATKIATQIFKNGDHIEVDTTKGVVRKI